MWSSCALRRFHNERRTQVEYPQIGIQGGGTSANTAVALAKIGLDVSFVGTVGDDQYGRFVMQDFKDAGVDVTGLVADSTLSTVGVFAFVDDRGERYLWGCLANGNRSRCSTKTLCRCT